MYTELEGYPDGTRLHRSENADWLGSWLNIGEDRACVNPVRMGFVWGLGRPKLRLTDMSANARRVPPTTVALANSPADRAGSHATGGATLMAGSPPFAPQLTPAPGPRLELLTAGYIGGSMPSARTRVWGFHAGVRGVALIAHPAESTTSTAPITSWR